MPSCPHVDELRPVHNLESLEDLCAALLELPARPRHHPGAAGRARMAG